MNMKRKMERRNHKTSIKAMYLLSINEDIMALVKVTKDDYFSMELNSTRPVSDDEYEYIQHQVDLWLVEQKNNNYPKVA